jgi:hypothetical protein
MCAVRFCEPDVEIFLSLIVFAFLLMTPVVPHLSRRQVGSARARHPLSPLAAAACAKAVTEVLAERTEGMDVCMCVCMVMVMDGVGALRTAATCHTAPPCLRHVHVLSFGFNHNHVVG